MAYALLNGLNGERIEDEAELDTALKTHLSNVLRQTNKLPSASSMKWKLSASRPLQIDNLLTPRRSKAGDGGELWSELVNVVSLTPVGQSQSGGGAFSARVGDTEVQVRTDHHAI